MFEINDKEHIRYIIKDMLGEMMCGKEFTFIEDIDNILVNFDEDLHSVSKEVIQFEMDNYNSVKKKYNKNLIDKSKLCIVTDKDFLYDTYELIKQLNKIGYSVDILHNGNFYYIKEEFKDVDVTIYDMVDFNGNSFIQDYVEETGNSNFLIYNDNILGKLSKIKNISRFYTLYFSTMKNIGHVQKICSNFNKDKDIIITNSNRIYDYFKEELKSKCIYLNILKENRYLGNKRILIPITSIENYDIDLMIKTLSPIGIRCLLLVEENIDIDELKERLSNNFIGYDTIRYDGRYPDMLDIVTILYSDFFKTVVSYDTVKIPEYLGKTISRYSSITLSSINSYKNIHIKDYNIINIIKNIIKKYGNPFDANILYSEYDEKYLLEAKEILN